MLPIVIAIQQFYNSDLEFIAQEHTRGCAENRVEIEYTERGAHMACAIEVNLDELFPEGKYNVIYKIERHCKCTNLQRAFIFKHGTSRLYCPLCNLGFGQEAYINEPPPQEEEKEEEVALASIPA